MFYRLLGRQKKLSWLILKYQFGTSDMSKCSQVQKIFFSLRVLIVHLLDKPRPVKAAPKGSSAILVGDLCSTGVVIAQQPSKLLGRV